MSVNSPCTRICVINSETKLCIGCLRNIREITEWMLYSDTQKKEVLDKIVLRKQSNKNDAA